MTGIRRYWDPEIRTYYFTRTNGPAIVRPDWARPVVVLHRVPGHPGSRLEELSSRNCNSRQYPLPCRLAVQLALCMGWAARRMGFLHETVMARVGGALLDVPYAQGNEPKAVPTLARLGINSESPETLEPREVATLYYDKTLVRRKPSQGVADFKLPGKQERELLAVQAEYREYVEETSGSPI